MPQQFWPRYNALDPHGRMALVSLMEADTGPNQRRDAQNVIDATHNRAGQLGWDTDRVLSYRKPGATYGWYQPLWEPAQHARAERLIASPEFAELSDYSRRRGAGAIADTTGGATHFVSRNIEQLAAAEPWKYKSFRSWATPENARPVEDASHLFYRVADGVPVKAAPLPAPTPAAVGATPDTPPIPGEIVATARPPSFAGAAAMPQPGASFAPQPEGFDLNNWVSSPLFQMGAGVLGSGNVGQGLMQGAQASNALSMNRLKMQTLQDARSEKLRRDQIWGSIFPGGRPNASHPLLKDVPPELQALAFARGADQGLADLQDYQMKRASSRIALEAAEQKRNATIAMLQRLRGGGGAVPAAAGVDPAAGGAAPTTGTLPVPSAAGPVRGPAPPIAAATPLTPVPGTFVEPPSMPVTAPPATTAATGIAPPTPLSPTDRRANLLHDQDAWDLVMGNLAVGDEKGAMTALEARYKAKVEEENKIAAERRAEQMKISAEQRAPALEEAKKLGEERGKLKGQDENATKAAREMWRYVEQLDDAANALGDDRLWHATSPTLDERSWYNVPGHVAAWTSAERWNDRQKLLGYIDNIIVQARQTQRGLGTLTEGEQATLERAYAGMKSATNPQAFRDAIENLRAVLSNKIPERAGYQPEWVKKGLAERAKDKATFQQQQRPAELARLDEELGRQYAALAPPDATAAPPTREATPADVGGMPESPRRIDLIPPDPSAGRRVDSLASVKEGAAVYDTETGRWGKVIDGDFMSRKELQRRAMSGRLLKPQPSQPALPPPEPRVDERARRRAEIERQMYGDLARRARLQL